MSLEVQKTSLLENDLQFLLRTARLLNQAPDDLNSGLLKPCWRFFKNRDSEGVTEELPGYGFMVSELCSKRLCLLELEFSSFWSYRQQWKKKRGLRMHQNPTVFCMTLMKKGNGREEKALNCVDTMQKRAVYAIRFGGFTQYPLAVHFRIFRLETVFFSCICPSSPLFFFYLCPVSRKKKDQKHFRKMITWETRRAGHVLIRSAKVDLSTRSR